MQSNALKEVSCLRPFALVLLIASLLFLPTSAAYAQEHTGKVVAITDGDTFTLMGDNFTKKKIRLAEIDTPEKRQPYGNKAKGLLSDLIFGKEVIVEQTDIDRYGRIVGTVFTVGPDGEYLNINKKMVSSGAAWVYRKYSDSEELLEIEAAAKTEEKGLWALPASHRMAPWDWRHKSQEEINNASQNVTVIPAPDWRNKSRKEINHSSPNVTVIPAPTDFPASKPVNSQKLGTTGFRCGSKKYCGEMSSCSEARFYLTQCGLSRLDGDKDGVPCEKLCR